MEDDITNYHVPATSMGRNFISTLFVQGLHKLGATGNE